MSVASTSPSGSPAPIGRFAHGPALSLLARAEPEAVKGLAEALLPDLGAVSVLKSRSGLVAVPCRDTAQGALFLLGEALAAEAHVRLDDHGGVEGYGACLGRDLEQAMAIALIDAAAEAGIGLAPIEALLERCAQTQSAEDDALLRRVAATRVEMETF